MKSNYSDDQNKQAIHDAIATDIINLVYPPGSFVREADLGLRFNISRTPVREVVKKLAVEQYVEVIPRHGNKVTLIDMRCVRQLMEMRVVLEGAVLKELTMSETAPDLSAVREVLALQRETVDEGIGLAGFWFLDNEFHRLLFEAAGKPVWWESIKRFETHYTRYRRLDMMDSFDSGVLYGHHANILAAVDRGDIVEAVEVLRSHVGICLRRMPVLLEKYPGYFVREDV